ncbi:serine/arginine repetitive matrix protein 2-like isoform X3 [Haliotis rubra]|uniref:serine/arginine repetitive matrix protein 2-like isoform X3 n=1 Tax=Haliotis rubra TaxID=36100 RepID=UPI001EE5B9C8|nr:serine/arginine repetitive matrix protein 2-like isoform X3 [Haliotis rubra]
MPPPPSPRHGYRKLNVDMSLVPASQHSVFVRGLPRNASPDDVRDLFAGACGHCSIVIHKVRANGKFLVLRFEKTEEAQQAINKFDGWEYKGQHFLQVDWYKDVLKYHLEQKKKQYPDRLFGARAVSRAKRWQWQFRPLSNKTGVRIQRPFGKASDWQRNRFYNRSSNASASYENSQERFSNTPWAMTRESSSDGSSDTSPDRSSDQFHWRSRERSHDGSRERSQDRLRQRSVEGSRERSQDRFRERSVDESSERSQDRLRQRSHEGSRDRSQDRFRERSVDVSSERLQNRLTERSQDRLTERSQDRLSERSQDRLSERSCDGSRENLLAGSLDGSLDGSRERSSEGSCDKYGSSCDRKLMKAQERPCDVQRDVLNSVSREMSRERCSSSSEDVCNDRRRACEKTSERPENVSAKTKPCDPTNLTRTRVRSMEFNRDQQTQFEQRSSRITKSGTPTLHGRREDAPNKLSSSENVDKHDTKISLSTPASSQDIAIDLDSPWSPPSPTSDDSELELAPEPSQKRAKDFEPGGLASGSSPDDIEDWYGPMPPKKRSSNFSPSQISAGVKSHELVGIGILEQQSKDDQSATKQNELPQETLSKTSNNSTFRGCWIEVGKISKKGPKTQYRKFMLGKDTKCLKSEISDKEHDSGINSSSDKKVKEDKSERKSSGDSDNAAGPEWSPGEVGMRRLEEACTMSLHHPPIHSFTREILEPRGPGTSMPYIKPHNLSDKKTISTLERIRAEEIQTDTKQKSSKKTQKKSPLYINPEEETPNKDEHFDASVECESASSSRPFFLRFTPHRLSYQSPLAVFTSMEEPRLSADLHPSRKKMYLPSEDASATVVSKPTGVKSLRERTSSALPLEDRNDLEFIDSELEKSYDEKFPDSGDALRLHKRIDSRTKKMASLVPYPVADHSFQHSMAESSNLKLDPDDDTRRWHGSGGHMSRDGRRNRSLTKMRESCSLSTDLSSSQSRITSTSTTSDSTMETSDSSLSSAVKHPRHGKHLYLSNRKLSSSPNRNSLKETLESPSVSSKNRSKSPKWSRSRSRSMSPGNSSKKTLPATRKGSRSPSPSKRSPLRSRSTSPTYLLPFPDTSRKRLRSPNRSQNRSRSSSPRNRSASPLKRKRCRSPRRSRSRSLTPDNTSTSPSNQSRSPNNRQTLEDGEPTSQTSQTSNCGKSAWTSTPKYERWQRKALSRGQMQRVHLKKQELEAAFKSDCETICNVTKVLLSKDPSLEKQMCNSAKNTLTDLGAKFVTQLQEFIDSLSSHVPRSRKKAP